MKHSPVYAPAADQIDQLFDRLQPGKVFLLTDENTHRHCRPLLSEKSLAVLRDITVPAGEEHKNLDTCRQIWEALTEGNADRQALLINLGGGVIGDMGGFAASVYKRGIRFVQVPTTVLAQVDASVGGKLGVDFDMLKNHIGLFAQPEAVIIDHSFLRTLPERQARSGFAELLKHGLIADIQLWNDIRGTNWEDMDWSEVIPRGVKIKEEIVGEDFRESGRRKLLNFGHTIGHAVETALLRNGGDILHGEAVAAGMIMEARLSVSHSGLSLSEFTEIKESIDDYFGRIALNEDQLDRIIELTVHDKKNRDNKILMTLLTGLGSAQWDIRVEPGDIRGVLESYLRDQI